MHHFKDIALLIAGRGLQLIGGLATIRLVTGLMSPGEVGIINQAMSLVVLLSGTVVAPVFTYFMRGFFGWLEAGTLFRQLRRFLSFVIAVACASGLLVWVLQGQVGPVSSMSAGWLALLCFVYLLGHSSHTLATSSLNLLGYRGAFVGFTNLAVWGGLAAAVALFAARSGPETWLLGVYLGFVLSSWSFVVLLRRLTATSSSHSGGAEHRLQFAVSPVFMFVWPQAVVYGLWWIQSQSYRFILADIDSIASVGLFATGYMVCSVPMQAFESLFNEFYSPTLYRALKGHRKEELARAWNRYANAYMPAVILFGAFLVGGGVFLVKLLLSARFQVVAPILLWPALTETMRATSSSLYTMGIVKVDMKLNVPPVVAGAVVAPVLLVLLAPHEPLLGTGIALFGASAVVLGLVIPISYRALPVKWPLRRIVLAGLWGLPMVVGGQLAAWWLPDVTLWNALAILGVGLVYLAAAEYVLARPWLGQAFVLKKGDGSGEKPG